MAKPISQNSKRFLRTGIVWSSLRIEAHVPELAAICDEVKARVGERSFVGANRYVWSSGWRLQTHYDPEDLLILQVEGKSAGKCFVLWCRTQFSICRNRAGKS